MVLSYVLVLAAERLRKGHDYISCFFDMDARRLVFATEGREHAVVAAFARFVDAHNGDSGAVREVS